MKKILGFNVIGIYCFWICDIGVVFLMNYVIKLIKLVRLWVCNVDDEECKWIYDRFVIYLNCGEIYEDIND